MLFDKQYFNSDEAAKYIGCSKSTLLRYNIPAIKKGRYKTYSKDALDQFLANKTDKRRHYNVKLTLFQINALKELTKGNKELYNIFSNPKYFTSTNMALSTY